MATYAGRVNPSALPRWNTTTPTLQADADSGTQPGDSRFPYDETLNRKIILCQADLCALEVDAIVNTTNERLNDRTGVSKAIFESAGPELAAECGRLEGCHTGEAVISKGYNLPASYVIHTVGPRFSVKYQTAAENALHGCYRRCLEVLKENGLESIAYPLVNTERKGYPKEQAAHIAIRTVRRFLEKFGEGVTTVVLCMDEQEDLDMYQNILPLYFPRNSEEETAAGAKLPPDVGNELGESVIAERKIRITAMPGMSGDDIPVTTNSPRFKSKRAPRWKQAAPPALDDDKENQDSFTNVQENPDDIRRRFDKAKTKEELAKEEAERRYQYYLTKSQEEDLTDIEAYNFIYESGTDSMGRPVVVMIANRIPAASVEPDRLMLYLIKVLDPIVNNDYTIVYFHTKIQSENKPSFSAMRQMYDIFNRKYKKNLKRLFVVHPSWFVKMVTFFATPFVSKKFWRKIKQLTRVMDLYDELNPKTLKIPEDVLKYDQEENAADYAMRYSATPGTQPDDHQPIADDV